MKYGENIPIFYYPNLLKITGTIEATLYLSELITLSQNHGIEWVARSSKMWTQITGLSSGQQFRVRKLLISKKLIEIKKEGFPSKLFIRIRPSFISKKGETE